MADPKYICLSCDKTFVEDELYQCHNFKCKEYMCPICGGEITTNEEYDEAQKANG